MATYTITLQTLTPIHIGANEELRLGFDFIIHKGRTWRLDEDAILEAKWKELKLEQRGVARYPLPGEVLTESDFHNPALFRYTLRGAPRSRKADARVQAFIKDAQDQPYIPGSSLKGAIRTALAWTGWDEVHPRLDRSAIGHRRSWAGRPLEQKIFGRDPNHDLLRALQVSDLHGNLDPNKVLGIVVARVLTRGSLQSPIGLEALMSNHTLTGTLKIDESLFSSLAERNLRFGNRKHWLEEIIPRLQQHSLARIKNLMDWFAQVQGAEKIARYYHQLYTLKLPPRHALLQLGWGSGWDGKTFWTHLQENEHLFEKLMRDFRLQHKRSRNAPPTRAKDFPTSRRVITTGPQNAPKIAAPFGWVIISLDR